jgi:AcrR family transcriptional regulator
MIIHPESLLMSKDKPRKRDLTRAKVIRAAIDCIYNEGFHAAHTNRIAEQAGVSWGVLQYHFGDKDGLLQAVLDNIFEDFTTTLSNANLQGELKSRIEALVNMLWSLVSQPEYRVSVAILRNAGRSPDSSIDGRVNLDKWSGEIGLLWDQVFEEYQAETTKTETARRLLFAALRGLADELNPRDKTTKKQLQQELAALTSAVHFLLTGESA